MKNIATKIIILTTALIVAVGAVLYFIKTVVDPPIAAEQRNMHVDAMEASIKSFDKSKKSINYDDSLYLAIKDKISVFASEKFITEVQKDFATANLVQTYLPIFKEDCYSKFNAQVWRENDHTKMLARITDLRSLTLEEGKRTAVSGSAETELQQIEVVISNYRSAKRAAAKNTFTSIEQAMSDINAAARYERMPYISNCKDLVAKLRNVKVNIANSHWQYLQNLVAKLARYTSFPSIEEYNTFASNVADELDRYANMSSVYGSSFKDVSSLRSSAGSYQYDATMYFESRGKSISVNTYGSSWCSMSSPDSNYDAYKSYSNFHVSNSDAKMSITISGYSSFTFYIRSYAEGSYDYVMVGSLDTMPHRDNYYRSTKGNQNSGSYLSAYTPVTYNNLNPALKYTIHVVYTKDGSNNYNDDRGYVLIPRR